MADVQSATASKPNPKQPTRIHSPRTMTSNPVQRIQQLWNGLKDPQTQKTNDPPVLPYFTVKTTKTNPTIKPMTI
ncbi:hypothetical protein N7478_004947 [Penicillium angulare]|uniref:uncharacterized protein n=1 Tax=Penicillium angulare TaxID=116970 RepID=UPI002540A78D|nr:uncharacterized protein N7478_004947 [Penicillium angulare]KAJ5279575.1 hypothetical protein N7478_004947 [Penicillium angulare]